MKKQRMFTFSLLILSFLISSIWAQPFIVSNTFDNGGVNPPPGANTGTLRQAIVDANATAGPDVIRFAIASPPPMFIFLQSALPPLTDGAGVTIDGYTELGAMANTIPQGALSNAVLQVHVNGNGFDAFTINSNNNIIKGLIIQNCNRGILIDGSFGMTNFNKVLGCYIGTNQLGNSPVPNNIGIEINNGAGDFAMGNSIGDGTPGGRNLISGNTTDGIMITDPGTDGNLVTGNFIGTDVSCTSGLPNQRSGVFIRNGAASNTVGMRVSITTTAERNIISGNLFYGIEIDGLTTSSNAVIGNFIGTDATGLFAIGNMRTGVRIANQATSNTVGVEMNNAYGNLISGNGLATPNWDGVAILSAGTSSNRVEGNYIGTDITGSAAIPNGYNGVSIFSGASMNDIGGLHQNVISGNTNDGVWIDGFNGTNTNNISNNFIGLDASGLAGLPNGRYGVLIDGGAFANQVGPTSTTSNYISANLSDGVHIADPGTINNMIQNTRIGVDILGNPFGNGGNGIHLRNNASNNQIGGTALFQQVVVSNNTLHGIFIDNAQNNSVLSPIPGIAVQQNVISNNGVNGITVINAGAVGNAFSQNSIHTNTSLDIDLNNDGVTMNDLLDPDVGPNNLLNFPVINSVLYIMPAPIWGGNTISGTIDVPTPLTTTIEIYNVGLNPHPSGYGGGDIYLTSTTPDALGNWSVTINGSATQPIANLGDYVTAIAIDALGNTSEFGKQAGVFSDVNMDPNNLVQNEVSMAIVQNPNPAGPPLGLLAAYNDDPYPQPPGGPGIGVSNSLDGGATWSAQQLTIPPDPFSPTGATYARVFDPTATADIQGSFYVAYIADDNNWAVGPSSGFFIQKSTDLGMTWNVPIAIAVDPPPLGPGDPNYRYNDRCQITADINPASPFAGQIYVTWIKDRGWTQPLPFSDIYFSASSDGGMTWSPAITLNSIGNMGNMPTITVASDGTIYVCWVDYNVLTGGTGAIYLNVSSDGGLTWLPGEYPVTSYTLPPINVSDATGILDALAKGAAVVGVAPNIPTQVYIVYAALATSGDESDINFIRSTMGGTPGSWSVPTRINNDPLPPVGTPDQILPWMNVKPNGIIDIAWYDRRNDPNDQKWDVYLAYSIDGGINWGGNNKVNTIPASPTPTTPSGSWMGEYLGLVGDYYNAYVGFTSSFSDVNGDVYFNSVRNPNLPMDFGDAPDPSYPTMLFNDGARHRITGMIAPWLGPISDNPDIDPGGQPDPLAQGDDLALPDDENGVTIPTLVPGTQTTVVFEVTNGPAFVDGWIDFNKNGVWGDLPSEYIIAGNYPPGIHPVIIQVPVLPMTPPPYGTFARFRINSFNPLGPSGYAFDGEVEDYSVQVDHMKWLGTSDSLWSNPANWNAGILPDSTVDVIISGSMVAFPVVQGMVSCKDLIILDGGKLVVDPGGMLDVHGDLIIGQGTSGLFIMRGGITNVKGKTTLNPGSKIDIQAGTFNSG